MLVTDHNVRETLKITDRSYLIKDGKVRTHGRPQQIIHDPIAINEYLGTSFNDEGFGSGALHGDRAAEMPVHLVLEQEKIRRLVERLKGPEAAGAAAELLGRGPDTIPALIEALERRDVELRRQAFQILQTILQGAATFDPYAPEAQRRQQIASLREQYDRKAG